MSIRRILTVGDPLLRQVAEPVPKVTNEIIDLLEDMLDTMYDAPGIGLAAPQIGVAKRVIVIDIGEGPLAVINPEIRWMRGLAIDIEGCLSVPERQGYVKRAEEILVQGLNERGRPVEYEAEGLLARVFQHELDHLDGKLFIDQLESFEELEEQKG